MSYSVPALPRLPDLDHDHFPAPNPMSPHAKLLLLACVWLTLLPGCGQRGPLYLPDKSTTEAGTTEAGTPQAGEIPGSGTESQAGSAAANNTNDGDDAER